ncbi:FecR family protein [Rugamonas sp. CCM 8940]|uniref:FecR family protein n=1 Tax=Rugamonas sp. CCM 8940 TaxID=2765359 RepID=UPI0018F4267D|nr:FecR domain-containing protein [Rugamonas sp. CCM 8940]MBJ7311892.1 FecR domain-containing protein [Rugamonas sp. CCM 8940]
MSRQELEPGRADAIDGAAAQWLLRRDAGLSAAEQAALQHWLDSDAAHALAWQQMCRADTLLAGLPAARVAALDRSGLAPAAMPAAPSGWLAQFLPLRWLGRLADAAPRAALAACLLLACGLLGYQQLHQPGYSQTFTTARGQYAEQRLPDGSSIELDTATEVQVALYADHREVRLLRGQAMFHVKPEPQRPFHVEAGAARVTVLGTHFSVRNVDGLVNVAVQQGKVAVAAPGRNADAPALLAGDGLTLAADGPAVPASVVPAAVGSWRERRVNFDNATLAEALAEFERYADSGLRVDDAALAQLRLSGSFDVGNPAQFAAALPLALPVRVVGDGRVKRILPR